MSNHSCSVCLKERKWKLRMFSQQMLLDQMACNYYLDHWREGSSKIAIWLSQMGPLPQLLIKGKSISKWDEEKTQKELQAPGFLNNSNMSWRRKCASPSWADAHTSVDTRENKDLSMYVSICTCVYVTQGPTLRLLFKQITTGWSTV